MGKEVRKRAIDVILEVASRNDIGVAAIMEPGRRRAVSWPRQEAMYEIFMQCPHLSLPGIANALGGLDHTSVLHGVQQHCRRLGMTYEDAKAASGRVSGRGNGYPRGNPVAYLAKHYGPVMEKAMSHA
jgi:hypothetical protein